MRDDRESAAARHRVRDVFSQFMESHVVRGLLAALLQPVEQFWAVARP
jgi:hypothetical protein